MFRFGVDEQRQFLEVSVHTGMRPSAASSPHACRHAVGPPKTGWSARYSNAALYGGTGAVRFRALGSAAERNVNRPHMRSSYHLGASSGGSLRFMAGGAGHLRRFTLPRSHLIRAEDVDSDLAVASIRRVKKLIRETHGDEARFL